MFHLTLKLSRMKLNWDSRLSLDTQVLIRKLLLQPIFEEIHSIFDEHRPLHRITDETVQDQLRARQFIPSKGVYTQKSGDQDVLSLRSQLQHAGLRQWSSACLDVKTAFCSFKTVASCCDRLGCLRS